MNEQPLSKSDPSPPVPGTKLPSRKTVVAAKWAIFITALIACTALGAFATKLEDGVITRKAAYLPLGCLLSGVIGWLLTKWMKPTGGRLLNAVHWAGFSIIGFAAAELIAFGGYSDATAMRIAVWGTIGGLMGLSDASRAQAPKP
jgi:hypothetical protein